MAAGGKVRPMMRRMFIFRLLALGCAALPAAAEAGIVWENRVVEIDANAAKASPASLTAKFKFRVEGAGPVTLSSTESDCGCTTAQLTKMVYAPGESGEISLIFVPGERTGPQVKSVRVRASDQAEPHVLTLKAAIPEFARATPQFVYWAHDEATAPKTIRFEIFEAPPGADITVTTNNPGMKAEPREVEKGRVWEIVVTPAQTKQFLLATVQVLCHVGGPAPRSVVAYATVKPPPPEASPATAALPGGR